MESNENEKPKLQSVFDEAIKSAEKAALDNKSNPSIPPFVFKADTTEFLNSLIDEAIAEDNAGLTETVEELLEFDKNFSYIPKGSKTVDREWLDEFVRTRPRNPGGQIRREHFFCEGKPYTVVWEE